MAYTYPSEESSNYMKHFPSHLSDIAGVDERIDAVIDTDDNRDICSHINVDLSSD